MCVLKDMYIHVVMLDMQDEWTALMIASGKGHVDVVNALLQHGANVHLQSKVKMQLL